jgi:hypothetical protein
VPQYQSFGAVLGFALLLYMLDISYWRGYCGALLRRLALSMLAVAARQLVERAVCPACGHRPISPPGPPEGSGPAPQAAQRRGVPTVNHQVAAFGLTCFEIVPYMPLAIFVLVVPVGALGLRYSVLRKTAGISIAWVLGASPPDLPLAIA